VLAALGLGWLVCLRDGGSRIAKLGHGVRMGAAAVVNEAEWAKRVRGRLKSFPLSFSKFYLRHFQILLNSLL
jgi:hypothetical protein